MTIFYQGTLQDGIALAVREAKAVICFVRDDAQLSSTWEEEYFVDDEFARELSAKSILLRLTAGSQEAGFLTSFCPISKFPTVVVIKNGTLQEYVVPDISKDDFRSRLITALGDGKASSSAQQPPNVTAERNDTAAAPTAPTPVASAAPAQRQALPDSRNRTQPAQQQTRESIRAEKRAVDKEPTSKGSAPASSASQKRQHPKADQNRDTHRTSQQQRNKASMPRVSPKPVDSTAGKAAAAPSEHPDPRPAAPRAPPNHYRLQVRLFDGSSVRSSFSPTQTIRGDVRPWLDAQMTDDKRPYNLKHVLTPLPSRTLSVVEESQTLQELGLGSTATLVMVPVHTYTEAYVAAGSSLPVRGISAVYNVVSSVATTATGLVGSFLGYGPTVPANDAGPSGSTSPASPSATRQPRSAGPNIRTLGDQRDERGNSQFYNGNQLNFEPRKDQDGKDD